MSTSKRFEAGVEKRLAGFNLEVLERDKHSVFALSQNLELIYFNPAYGKFGADNGAVRLFPLGRSVLEAIQGPLREYYQERFIRALSSGEPWNHEYACHSPELQRTMFQVAYPLEQQSGLVVINSLRVEAPMSVPGVAPLEDQYLQATALFTQCSNCRRMLRNDGSGMWDWVPAWVTDMPKNTSHSLCPTCCDYYWMH
jgi:hypothetical protein